MSIWCVMAKLQRSFHLSERLIRCITECNDLTNTDSVEGLLEEGADVNQPHGTLLPLQCACMIGDEATAETLLTHGAHVNTLDGYGRAALHYAAERNSACVELLINNDADVNIKDSNQDTALHWAVFKNKPNCTRALLQYGADVNAIDYNHDTPLSWVAQKGSLEPMKILLEYNARVDTVNLNGNSPIYRSASMQASGLPDDNDEECLELLLRASGQFDLRLDDGELPRVLQGDNKMRELILPFCRNSRKLQEICRFVLRYYMGAQYMPNGVLALPLPRNLQQYLLLQR